jgi:hypothetical protein
MPLTALPADIFRYNLVVTTFESVFGEIWQTLTTIPADLFRYNTSCLSFKGALSGCNLATLNDTIFYAAGGAPTRFLNQSPDFTNCFNRSGFSGTQGTAPDVWNCDFGTGTPITTDCFHGGGNSLTSLTNYASIPGAWI